MRLLKTVPALLLLGAPALASAATAERAVFGTLPGGAPVEAITLRNAHGMQVRILAYGALIQQLLVPDAKGHFDDVVLGYDDLAGYLARHNYFGASIGRYANRIGGGTFTLDGVRYVLSRSDGDNTLHGGAVGFGQRLWTLGALTSGPRASVTLSLRSADGDQGFPGNLDASVTYTLDEDDTLTMVYGATTDRPTVVNLTNHAYFNLAGATSGRSVLEEWLTVPADSYTPTDKTLVPTGELRPVAGTAFDFRTPQQIGARIRDGHDEQLVLARGYDHNFVITKAPTPTSHLIARVEDRKNGRVLEVTGTAPGVQVYSGNFLDGTISGKAGVTYRQGDALCLEPQLFPDTPNKPAFGSARLAPGEHYTSTMAFHFSTRKPG